MDVLCEEAVIELTEHEAAAIAERQGWTAEELRRWLADEEPLPAVRW